MYGALPFRPAGMYDPEGLLPARMLAQTFRPKDQGRQAHSGLMVFKNGVRVPLATAKPVAVAMKNTPPVMAQRKSTPAPTMTSQTLNRTVRLLQDQVDVLQQQVKANAPTEAEQRQRKLAAEKADLDRFARRLEAFKR